MTLPLFKKSFIIVVASCLLLLQSTLMATRSRQRLLQVVTKPRQLNTKCTLVSGIHSKMHELNSLIKLRNFVANSLHPVILYTDSSMFDALPEVYARNNLLIVIKEVEEFTSYRQPSEFLADSYNLSSKVTHQYWFQYERVNFLADASIRNPFASNYFFWFDVESLHDFELSVPQFSLVHQFQLLEDHQQEVLYLGLRPLPLGAKHVHFKECQSVTGCTQYLSASQFGGSVDACLRLQKTYHSVLSEYNESNWLLGEEEIIHTKICSAHSICLLVNYAQKYNTLLDLLIREYRPQFMNQLAVCTLSANENEFFPEWIEFHKLQGFDQFIIYDDGSRNPTLFLKSYITSGVVSIVDWKEQCNSLRRKGENHGFVPCQFAAFVDCKKRVTTRWLGIFDVDEFIFGRSSHDNVLSYLHQHQEISGLHFRGAVFGNNYIELPYFAHNSTDIPLVIEKYSRRQSVDDIIVEKYGDRPDFWAVKEIAKHEDIDMDSNDVHGFKYIRNNGINILDISDPSTPLRFHHYQYRSVFQSHLKAKLNGNPHVEISDPLKQEPFNLVEDKAAIVFADKVRSHLLRENGKDMDGILKRGVTIVITSIGRIDLLNQTLETFNQYNTYPISRGILVDDSGIAGIADFAVDIFPFPLKIIYNPDLGESRHHKIGMLGLIQSIDLAYSFVETEFIFHMEDDWEFFNSGFIEKSIDILDTNPQIIQVWLRSHDDGHPVLPAKYKTKHNQTFHMMDPEFGEWHGFSFNPGLRRLVDYKSLGRPFYEMIQIAGQKQQIAGELDVNLLYYKLGYKAATTDVTEGFLRHIGGGRTTDPGCSSGCL